MEIRFHNQLSHLSTAFHPEILEVQFNGPENGDEDMLPIFIPFEDFPTHDTDRLIECIKNHASAEGRDSLNGPPGLHFAFDLESAKLFRSVLTQFIDKQKAQ